MLCDDLEGWAGKGELKKDGICVYFELIHAAGQRTPAQHCKAVPLQ